LISDPHARVKTSYCGSFAVTRAWQAVGDGSGDGVGSRDEMAVTVVVEVWTMVLVATNVIVMVDTGVLVESDTGVIVVYEIGVEVTTARGVEV
jgi:hypothetical protein